MNGAQTHIDVSEKNVENGPFKKDLDKFSDFNG